MRLRKRGAVAIGLACSTALAATVSPARAQVATLGKGHQIILDNGLQIWGLDTGAQAYNHANVMNANFNGVMWSWEVDPAPHPKLAATPVGAKWGKWTDHHGDPALALDA